MYPAMGRYYNQAFNDMWGKWKKNCIVKKSLWPVPTQGIVEQAEQNGELHPSKETVDVPSDHSESKVAEDTPDKGYN